MKLYVIEKVNICKFYVESLDRDQLENSCLN